MPDVNACRTVVFFDHTAAWSGGEIALYELVRRLDRRLYHPIVALGSAGPLHVRLTAAGIETHIFPLGSEVVETRKDSLGGKSALRPALLFSTLAYARRLARFLRERRADVLHTNSLKSDVIGGIAARTARVPVVWHIRDRIETDYLPAPAVLLFRRLCRYIPNGIAANSEATLQTLHLPASKVTEVVYSGVPSELLAGVSENTVWPQNADAPRIGIIGRITRWKGQHVFLRAAAQVRAQFPNARFQVIGAALFGEEDYDAEVRALVAALGLEESVEFTGFRNDIFALLKELDILVHASITGEPFGQVVVQGMAAGKPVVATNGGGIPEIVVPGETGLLVPMGDAQAMAEAIGHLLTHPDDARAMGEAGRRRVQERFTIEETARAVERLYETLLAPRAR